MEEMFAELGLMDAWREDHPDERRYTRYGSTVSSRLDRWYVPGWSGWDSQALIGREGWKGLHWVTDHVPIVLRVYKTVSRTESSDGAESPPPPTPMRQLLRKGAREAVQEIFKSVYADIFEYEESGGREGRDDGLGWVARWNEFMRQATEELARREADEVKADKQKKKQKQREQARSSQLEAFSL